MLTVSVCAAQGPRNVVIYHGSNRRFVLDGPALGDSAILVGVWYGMGMVALIRTVLNLFVDEMRLRRRSTNTKSVSDSVSLSHIDMKSLKSLKEDEEPPLTMWQIRWVMNIEAVSVEVFD